MKRSLGPCGLAPRAAAAATVLAIGMAGAGCGGDDDSSTTAGQTTDGGSQVATCTPEVIAASIDGPSLVAVNNAGVFWDDRKALRYLPHSGPSPTTLATATDSLLALEVDDSHAYWTDSAGLHRVEIASGTQNTLAGDPACPVRLALDVTSVIWSDSCTDAVMRTTKDGSQTTSIATAISGVEGLVVDGTYAYVAGGDQGTVFRVALPDGASTSFATGQNDPQGITVDGDSVYWSSGVSVMKALKSGGAPTAISTESVVGMFLHITSTAADSTGVYWPYSDAMRVLPAGSATPVTLASGQAHPQHVVLHSTGIYWVENNAGTVRRCPR